ncbi:MAG: RNA polymerase sigma factor [Phycisphaerales bacterium]|nr:MAG: RNA polymerase sigma factor [Phycisphaerales bacterium]
MNIHKIQCTIGDSLTESAAYNRYVDAPTDEQLLQEYLAGEAASFELLVRRHAPELHQFAMRFTGSSVTAEDVVQETFLQVHTAGKSFDPKRRFKPWLFTVAANKARDQLRRRKRRRELPFEAQVAAEGEAGQRFIDLLSGDEDIVDDELLLEEKRRAVRNAIDSMPPKLREVLILAYYHRFPYKEIAEIVDIPLGTVKSRLHGAVASFAERYRAEVREPTNGEP